MTEQRFILPEGKGLTEFRRLLREQHVSLAALSFSACDGRLYVRARGADADAHWLCDLVEAFWPEMRLSDICSDIFGQLHVSYQSPVPVLAAVDTTGG